MRRASQDAWAVRLDEVITKLEAYCRERNWAGWDPYDALNSKRFARTPLAKSRLARLALTQFLKRSPVNLRPLLGIEPEQNPKALALFLMGYLRLARGGNAMHRASAEFLASRLLELRSPGTPYWCWGYNFPWQMRTRLVPKFHSNLVCTTFAANALLDAYEAGLGEECLAAAASAGDYLVKELFWTDGRRAAFAYPLADIRVPIHNANFLGAALLYRLARLTRERRYLEQALWATRYSASRQAADGSWPYGDGPTQQWIDNFHTGYNLCELQSVARDLETDEFEAVLIKGFDFYLRHFFTTDGAPKYFHDRTYPIDVHSAAQSVITLLAFSARDERAEGLARAVTAWALGNMWDDDLGFFHYRVLRVGKVRTSYLRWAQAWMLFALIEMAGVGRPRGGFAMIECVFTLDYEIYGNGKGSLREHVLEPTARLAEQFRIYGWPLVVFPEALEFEKIEEAGSDPDIGKVRAQLCELRAAGHEIGLHLHPWWANARWSHGTWTLNWEDRNICALPPERIDAIVSRAIAYLRGVFADPGFTPLSYRSGLWAMQPTRTVAEVLSRHGIRIDSSVYKGGLVRDLGLDYRRAPRHDDRWRFTSDVNKPDPSGLLWEIPIHTEMVASWRMLGQKRLKVHSKAPTADGRRQSGKWRDFLRLRYPRKLDFCRMTYQEMVEAFERVLGERRGRRHEPMVLVAIGHSKDLVDLVAVRKFLDHLARLNVDVTTFSRVLSQRSF